MEYLPLVLDGLYLAESHCSSTGRLRAANGGPEPADGVSVFQFVERPIRRCISVRFELAALRPVRQPVREWETACRASSSLRGISGNPTACQHPRIPEKFEYPTHLAWTAADRKHSPQVGVVDGAHQQDLIKIPSHQCDVVHLREGVQRHLTGSSFRSRHFVHRSRSLNTPYFQFVFLAWSIRRNIPRVGKELDTKLLWGRYWG